MRKRSLVLYVTRVQRRGWLEQEHVRLFLGDGSMFDASRDNQELALFEPDVPVPETHAETPLDDQKEFILLIVVVPDELPLELDQLYLLAVQLADELRTPKLCEQRQLFGEIELFHDQTVSVGDFAPIDQR